jgi:SAM-dependent methyltransferase
MQPASMGETVGALLRASMETRYAGSESQLSDSQRVRFPRDRYQAAMCLIRPGRRILDVGCGSGYLLYNLRHVFSELVGLDFVAERVEGATAAFQARGVQAQFVAGPLESSLPWPDGYFDTVVWTDVIQFVPNLWAAFGEIMRVLSPRGQLVTTVPNFGYLKRIAELVRGRFPATSAPDEGLAVRDGTLYDDGTLHYFTFSSLRKLYRHAGITPDREVGYGRLGFVHQIRRELLSAGICISGIKTG